VRKGVVKKIGYDHLGQKFNRRLIEKIDNLLTRDHPSFSLQLPGGYILSRSYDEARILKGDGVPIPYSFIISGPGNYKIGKGKKSISVSIATKDDVCPLIEQAKTDPYFCVLDGESVTFPLEGRSFIDGDRVIPFGMRRRRKLKKLFIEHKVPLSDRKKIPVILSGDHIIWVPGVVRSAHHTLGGENKIIIVLEYKGN
jgi:tRNA(Ile)-lysidine synthase